MRTAALTSLLLFIVFMAVLPRLRAHERKAIPVARSVSDLRRWRVPLIVAAAALNGLFWAAAAVAICVFLGRVEEVTLVAGTVWAVTTVLTVIAIRTVALASPVGLNVD